MQHIVKSMNAIFKKFMKNAHHEKMHVFIFLSQNKLIFEFSFPQTL